MAAVIRLYMHGQVRGAHYIRWYTFSDRWENEKPTTKLPNVNEKSYLCSTAYLKHYYIAGDEFPR